MERKKFTDSLHVREYGFWNPENFVVDSGILGFGIWDTAQGIRNPTDDWNPESRLY